MPSSRTASSRSATRTATPRSSTRASSAPATSTRWRTPSPPGRSRPRRSRTRPKSTSSRAGPGTFAATLVRGWPHVLVHRGRCASAIMRRMGEPPSATPATPATFKTFEHEGWEEVARPYRDAFSSLTVQSVAPLLDAVAVAPGLRLLDVACGPGDASAAAALRGAQVTGVDFAAAMVEQASRLHPGLTFRTGDAEALPFDDASFDAVIVNFGVLHFADPDRAIAGAFRVLAPGGRFAFTVWAPPEKCEGFAIVLRSIEQHGRLDVPLPEGPPFFRFADADECRRVLGKAGFTDTMVRELPMRWR